ncbi:MAG: tRNA lysidine(34) synthetase TilS, partial [Candidatus Aminicenantes bacterium]|nr:tRNA lysidine(34) synthetase TilS [Candidatus Aminicenantes bacterium]
MRSGKTMKDGRTAAGSAAFRTFKRTVERYGLVRPGDKVLAACSGGPDSVALVHLLLELRQDIPHEIAVGHFNHRLRPAAASDEAFVRRLARENGLPFFSSRRDVHAYARRFGLNLEEAARTLRYEFLERTAARMGATRIATGHTMTDQAETLIMRLLRGTGLTGLGGILSVADARLIRPLLGLEREEIEAYLDERRLVCRRDETNEDLRFLRNRIRLELLPVLRTKFEPRLVQHLGRLALLFQDEERVIERVTAETAAGLVGRREERLELEAEKLRALERGLARRVVRFFLREVQGDLRGLTFDDVEDVLNLGEGREKTIRKGLVIRRAMGRLFAKSDEAGKRPRSFSYAWDGRGILEIPEAGLKV